MPGPPMAQARARSGRFGHHKTPAQEAYERDIILAWRKAGAPVLDHGPYLARVIAYMRREPSHYLSDGVSLSAAGRRFPQPTKKPDVDNFLKQVDALVACGAVPDDAYMLEARARKVWSPTPAQACLVFTIVTLNPTEGAPDGD